jgi:hypothetical protein
MYKGYDRYTYVSEDADRDYRLEALAGKPYTFKNLFPFPVEVVARSPVMIDTVGIVPAFGQLSVLKTKKGMVLQQDVEIHVIYNDPLARGTSFEIARPVFLLEDGRDVRLGDVVYEEKYTSTVQRSHSDIMGLRFHNHTTIPISIYSHGSRLADIAGDDGTSYMAGSKNSAYLTNANLGFNIGDELSIHFNGLPNAGPKGTKWCTVMVNDNYMSEVYVGETNQKFSAPVQDMYSYRVNEQDINGLKYYKNVTGYQTV